MYNIKNISLINSSIEYYDSFQTEIIDILNKIKYIKFVNNDIITDEINFYDKNKKLIFHSNFEYLSIYSTKSKIWKWAWSIPGMLKKNIHIIRKIFEYAFNLESEDVILKNILINSNININNDIELDMSIALSSKLCKKPFIFKYYIKNELNLSKDGFIPYKYNNSFDTKYEDRISDDLIVYLIILDY